MATGTDSLLHDKPSGLGRFVVISVVAHGALVAAMLLFNWAFGTPKVELNQLPIKASLVRLGKPRDEKLLPRKEEVAPSAPKSEEVLRPAAPVEPQAVALPSKDVAEPAKASAKKDGPKDAKKTLFDAFTKTAKPGKPEELEGQTDGDPNGDAAQQEGERYFGLLNAVVKRNYDVSSTIDEAERRRLRAEVALRIGPGGELLEVDLSKSSGNEQFDSAVLAAVKKAAPFSAPPTHLRDSLKKSGVSFVFTP
jgi:TonB family protein